jgi:hypothetical protein
MYKIIVLCALFAACAAHLGFYEGQRQRNDNFFADEGYAMPDPTGADDWSFEKPFNAYTSFALSTGPPTAPVLTWRNDTGFFASCTLAGWDDYDVILFDRTGLTNSHVLYLYPNTPACKNNLGFFPSVALLGPLGARDAVTNALIFTDPATVSARDLPPFPIPAGLGYKIKNYDDQNHAPRPQYYTPSKNADLYPIGWHPDCVENANAPGCTVSDFAIYHTVNTPGKYYGIVFRGDRRDGGEKIQDAGLIGGTVDALVSSDFARLGILAGSTQYGASIHGNCRAIAEDRILRYGD